MLVASTYNGADIYSNFDHGDAVLEQTLSEGETVKTHEVSKDGTYIVLGEYDNLKVYMNNDYVPCNISYCTKCFNAHSCQYCNNLLGYFVNETAGECQLCQLEACTKCRNLTNCSICDFGYFLNEEEQC